MLTRERPELAITSSDTFRWIHSGCRGPCRALSGLVRMRLFPSATARDERCTSAPLSRRSRAAAAQGCNPPSPLAAKLTRPKTSGRNAIKTISKRKKSAVHPIDLRDLESELELLPEPSNAPFVREVEAAIAVSPRGFTIHVSVLHALDLPNPCQIRSCRHPLQPLALISINDSEAVRFAAARHAKNYTSWDKAAQFSYHVDAEAAAQMYSLRVQVGASCSRDPMDSATITIGQLDDIVLSADSPREISQFHTVFRYHRMGNRVVKYFAGKLKLNLSIQADPETTSNQTLRGKIGSPSLTPAEPDPPPPTGEVSTPPGSLPVRPSFLPINFGDALQLKRKQLKATVAPESVKCTDAKVADDPDKVKEVLQSLLVQGQDHLVLIEDVTALEHVGDGIHASVRRAQIRRPAGELLDVAMKEFRYTNAECGAAPPLGVLHAFQQEFLMLQLVTASSRSEDLKYATMTNLIGITLTPRLVIYTDFCRDGSLAKCLENCKMWDQVPFKQKLELARCVAEGLARCHSLGIVHRDIKAHNIMVDGLHSSRPIAKIGDFGSAVVKRPPDPPLHEETGSSGYTAPEIFSQSGYDQRADIWSLGVVLWELLCTSSTKKLINPFLGLCGDDVVSKADASERPVIPANSLPPWCESLLQRCWAGDPAQRPRALEIAGLFQAASSYDTS